MQTTELNPDLEDDAQVQLNADGSLRHLLTLRGLQKAMLVELLDSAESYLSPEGKRPSRSTVLEGRTVANLFYEPSTRTRASFDLAGKRLGADVLNLDVNTSSRKKGESILDTIFTLEAMQVDIMVVRDASAGVEAVAPLQLDGLRLPVFRDPGEGSSHFGDHLGPSRSRLVRVAVELRAGRKLGSPREIPVRDR